MFKKEFLDNKFCSSNRQGPLILAKIFVGYEPQMQSSAGALLNLFWLVMSSWFAALLKLPKICDPIQLLLLLSIKLVAVKEKELRGAVPLEDILDEISDHRG